MTQLGRGRRLGSEIDRGRRSGGEGGGRFGDGSGDGFDGGTVRGGVVAEGLDLGEVVAYPLERLAAEHALVQSDLSGDDAGQLLQHASGQLHLERPYGGQRHARDRASMPERHGKHVVLRQHRDVRAPSLQLLTGHGSAGEQHLVRERPAEAVFQDVGRAHARREAVLHEIGAVHTVSGHHHDVRVETEREPATRGVSLDGDDDLGGRIAACPRRGRARP